MSLIITACPWCEATFTFGIAGTTMIGSGHTCDVEPPACGEAGCDVPGDVQVVIGGDKFEFRCRDHGIGPDVVTMRFQPRAAVASKDKSS